MGTENKFIFAAAAAMVVVGVILSTGMACRPDKGIENDETDDYQKRIQNWHEERLSKLKRPDGWLSLVGLFWLKEGENSFGAGEENDFVISGEGLPSRFGVFDKRGDLIGFHPAPGLDIESQQAPPGDIIPMASDDGGNPTVLRWKFLSWFIIKRGKRFGVRVRNAEHPRIHEFEGIERFPLDRTWRLSASFEKFHPAKEIQVPTVLGTSETQLCEGVLAFEYGGKVYRLEVTAAGENWFLVFGDQTNARETYGGGRFLVVKKPKGKGNPIWIDFNMAFNPPCVFSPFATCPLPRQENRLPFRVLAGEKMVKGSGH
jgi:uncharacterized protein (DUF1684 family)